MSGAAGQGSAARCRSINEPARAATLKRFGAKRQEWKEWSGREDLNLRPPGPEKGIKVVVVNVFNLLQWCFNRLIPAPSLHSRVNVSPRMAVPATVTGR